MKKTTKRIFVIPIAAVVLPAAAAGMYANEYYRAENVAACTADGDGTGVNEENDGWFFNGRARMTR